MLYHLGLNVISQKSITPGSHERQTEQGHFGGILIASFQPDGTLRYMTQPPLSG